VPGVGKTDKTRNQGFFKEEKGFARRGVEKAWGGGLTGREKSRGEPEPIEAKKNEERLRSRATSAEGNSIERLFWVGGEPVQKNEGLQLGGVLTRPSPGGGHGGGGKKERTKGKGT